MLKSFIHDALLYLGMARLRFCHAAHASGIQRINYFFFLIIFVSNDRQTEKNTNVLIMTHMGMEERGFAIGPLDAGQLLRLKIMRLRITLSQQIYFRTSFEQAQHVLWQTDWCLVCHQVSSCPFYESSYVPMLKLCFCWELGNGWDL